MEASGSGSQSMDRLVDLLNSMRSNSSGVEQQLASFMEEAQCSARSEETLAQVVSTIYSKAVSDRSFAATAAKLCDKMALFMVDGTKFRSLLLNMLQVRKGRELVSQVQQRRDVYAASNFPHLYFSIFFSQHSGNSHICITISLCICFAMFLNQHEDLMNEYCRCHDRGFVFYKDTV